VLNTGNARHGKTPAMSNFFNTNPECKKSDGAKTII